MPLYCCVGDCGWDRQAGMQFSNCLEHVWKDHGVDVEKGKGKVGTIHFCSCNDCPATIADGSGERYGLHLQGNKEVLQHLTEVHAVHATS